MIIFEDVDKAVVDSFDIVSREKKAFVLKVNGKTAKVGSGKSLWTARHFAACAVTNHLEWSLKKNLRDKLGNISRKEFDEAVKEYKQSLYDRGILQIVEITD